MFKLDWVGVESSPMCNCSSKYRVVWLEGVTRLQHGDEELGTSLSFPHLDCSYNTASVSVHAHPYHPLFFSSILILFSSIQCWKNLRQKLSTLHISLKQMRNFSWVSVASEYVIPLWSLPLDSTVTSRFLIKMKWSSTCQYDLFALPCVLGRQITQITLWNGLLLTPGHLLWCWRTLKLLGIVGGEGCKMTLKDELKFPSKQGTKQSSLGSTCPDEDGRCPISIILLTVSRLFPGEWFSLLT